MRYRSRRVDRAELSAPLICRFTFTGEPVDLPVLNVSPTGAALITAGDLVVPPGSMLEDAEMVIGDRTVWTGEAVVVYQVDPPRARIGLRFLSQEFDLHSLQIRDDSSLGKLEENLRVQARWQEELPDELVLAVGNLRRYLAAARDALERTEEELSRSVDPYDPLDEKSLLQRFFGAWGPGFHEQLRALSAIQETLTSEQIELSRGLATHDLLPLLYSCPMHQRAYDKPFGYSGDYLMMLLYFADRYVGSSLYARFLHYNSQHYPLGQTVIARERTMRQQLIELGAEDRPIRIASLACGPALEVQRWLASVETLNHPVQLILIDQDEQAMQYCHKNLNRQILDRDTSIQLQVELECLHLSVRQIIAPRDDAEEATVAGALRDLDLLYSAGLYDYLSKPVAQNLTERLYAMLRPGGRLFLGNLKHCPVTSWIMDNVLAWHLEYRTEESMLAVANPLEDAHASTTLDPTGRCIFLDVRKP